MARRDRDQWMSGKTIAAARVGDKAAYDDLLAFVSKYSFAILRRTCLCKRSREEISQEVSLRFRGHWAPARTKDSPQLLMAFVKKMTVRSLVDYFRKTAGYRDLLKRLEVARRLVQKEPEPLLEDGGAGANSTVCTARAGGSFNTVEGGAPGAKLKNRRNRAAGAEDLLLHLLEKQDGSYAVLFDHMDLETARRWLLEYLFPTITDYLCSLSGEKRAVAMGVWLADTEANVNGGVSDEQLRQILAAKRERLVRFLYNTSDLGSYDFPSGKDIAARLGMPAYRVTRLKQRIEADVIERLRQRWRATMPGAGMD